MDPEDALVVPPSWHAHLDGRRKGRLTNEEAEALLEDPYMAWGQPEDHVAALYTITVDRALPDALAWIDEAVPVGADLDPALVRAGGEALSILPSDEAFGMLLDRALASSIVTRGSGGGSLAKSEARFTDSLRAATDRFPRRAVRVLATRAIAGGPAESRHRALLRDAVVRHPDAASAAAEALPPEAAAAVRAILEPPAVALAPRDRWPEVLRDPPWDHPRRTRLAPAGKVPLAPLEGAVRVEWRGDERARWRRPEAPPAALAALDEAGWRALAERCLAEHGGPMAAVLDCAPRPIAVDLARRWTDVPRWSMAEVLRAAVARLEADALPLVERWLVKAWALEAALPLGSPTLAVAMAEALAKASAREAARAWLLRHDEAAATGLVPAALGAGAKARKAGVAGLLFLVREGRRGVVAEVAARYGAAASEALAPILDASPLDELPARLPKMPSFWDPRALPPLALRSGGALPPEAIEPLGVMLAFSQPGAPYAGIRQVADACTPASVAAFTWAIFEAWLHAGAPNGEGWAFLQLGWLGDDSVAYRLVAKMKAWPGQGAAKRAEKGLDVLAEMDSDVALLLVHQLSEKGRGSLRKNAAKKLARLAAVRGLSEDELADRLVPTLDLDADGSMVLDYGPRSFRVGFDEELLPYVLDERGARLEALPKPGKRDDPALAPAADARFKALKKAVRTVAKSQLTRLERAMATGRRWRGGAFLRHVVGHPLLVHVARRLVFGVYDGEALTVSFRVADDRSLADLDDAPIALDEDARVGIAHPAELAPETIERWRGVLADYELVPPFPQLDRARHAPPAEAREAALSAALGVTVRPQRVAALEDAGWIRGPVGDGGYVTTMERPIGQGRRLVLEVSPGLVVGMAHHSDDQVLRAVHLLDVGVPVSIAELSVPVLSELIRDLEGLRG